MPRRQPPRRSCPGERAGFSLAELMVVIVILGLLATLVVPRVTSAMARTRCSKASGDIMAIDCALREYASHHALTYPEDLEALLRPDVSGSSYLEQKSVPLDPWGAPYQYAPPGAGEPEPHVYTLGRDRAPGGQGPDADHSNRDLLRQPGG